MKPKKKTLGDVKRRINAMRNTKRQNPDGTVSTHKMAWGGNDEEGYSVYPTIFPNKDGSWTDYLAQGESRENWDSTVDEAVKRNEIIGGLSRSMAEDLADGSWKNMGKLELKRKDIPSIMKAKKKYEKGGKLKKSNPKMEKPKGYKEKSKKMGVSTLEERQAAKFNKFEKGGQVGPPKGKKLTKKMVDKQHSSDLAKSMNLTNELAKQASTGLKDNGFPMSKAAKKALAKDVEKRKKRESTSKPNYRDVGKPIPGGSSPRFKKGGKMMK